ncbi:MAG: UvrD-helicase domain-containing protein, partial [Desulfovibrionaceae bacterium]|nr:UvrD-helicase domain-containing protein [Desulfovibrionaceae bacterium]
MLEQIKASAGSGKTHALTRRFLELLCRQSPWEEKNIYYFRQNWLRQPGFFSDILAVTFTNKAAAEMKARVLAALKGIALGVFPDAPAALGGKDGANLAASLIMTILRRYDALNIRTIDSLLNLLARISAVGLHIPPNFDLTFDEETFLSPLYEELLDMAEQGREEIAALLESCVRHLLDHANFNKFTPRGEIQKQLLKILALLQKSEQLPCLNQQILEKRLQAQHAQLNAVLYEFTAGLDTRKISPNAHFRHFMRNLELYIPGEVFPSLSWALKKSFADCCQSKYHLLIDAELEQTYRVFGQELLQSKFFLNAHVSALALLPYTRTATLLLPEIEQLQQKFSLLSGTTLPVLAAKALNMENGVSEACCRLGSRLNYLLIDEFQDTSRLQWTAMETLVQEALARGGVLCYAGDVKQAIYSWRGGDSSLFEEVISAPEIVGAAGDIQRHSLNSNWRSAPAVIQHNNRFFSRLADPELAMRVAQALLPAGHPEDYLRKAASVLSSTFTDAEQYPAAKPETGKIPGFVQITQIWAENPETLHAEVQQNLRKLFTEDLLLRRRAGDIAVLVRSNDEGDFVSQYLLDQGIKVMTEHSFRLEGHPLIRRLVALLRFLDYPPDNLAFMSAIASPDFFVPSSSLTSERLLDWAMGIISERRQDDNKRGKPLFHFFIRDFPDEWGLWLEPFYKQAGLMGIYDMVFEICRHFALLERYHEHDAYLRRFLELAHLAEKKGLSSLAAFLDFWRETGKEEKISSPENPDAVRVMTIHGAKGLEFEVVVMPFHRFTGNRRSEYEILEKDQLPLLVRQDPEINFRCHE